ncbi:MAG TPA: hypothetical protein VIL41_07860 [Coriobacteriia bacterium]
MIRVIGNADEFWRLRLTRLDTTEHFDFEWHDDILYRQPSPDPGDEVELWHVEAVRLDDSDIVVRLATCHTQSEARELLERVAEDLADMTKSEFEAAYVDGAEQGDTGVE